MSERFARVGRGIELCYEEHGAPSDPAVLLVMGLGLDLCWWRDALCEDMVAQGLRVIRFDNRDVGRSTHVTGPGVGGTGFLLRRATASYTLADMADDAAGLLAEVAPEGAHVVGASMGSLIAQELAIRHPERVHSLLSIMGRPGDGRTGKVAKTKLFEFLRPASSDPVEGMVDAFRRIGSKERSEEDDEDVRIAGRRSLGRATGTDPGRQLAAILNERDRTADLGRLAMPVTVLHGLRDRVIQPSGGRATAAAVPGSTLIEVEGMGHDLPRWVWPQVLDAIGEHI